MSTITNLKRLCVYACTLRGRKIEIVYPFKEKPYIVDADTRRRLKWRLTPAERKDLGAVIVERYSHG